MRAHTPTLLAAVACLAVLAAGQHTATSFTFDQIRYTFYPGEVARSWSEADAFCQSMNKELAVFASRAQIRNVSEYLSPEGGVWTGYKTNDDGRFEAADLAEFEWKKEFGTPLLSRGAAKPGMCGLLSVANYTGIVATDCDTKKAALCSVHDPDIVQAETMMDAKSGLAPKPAKPEPPKVTAKSSNTTKTSPSAKPKAAAAAAAAAADDDDDDAKKTKPIPSSAPKPTTAAAKSTTAAKKSAAVEDSSKPSTKKAAADDDKKADDKKADDKKAAVDKKKVDDEEKKAADDKAAAEADKKKAEEERKQAELERKKAEEERRLAADERRKAADEKKKADDDKKKIADAKKKAGDAKKRVVDGDKKKAAPAKPSADDEETTSAPTPAPTTRPPTNQLPVQIESDGCRFTFFPNHIMFGGYMEYARFCEDKGLQPAVFTSRRQLDDIASHVNSVVMVWTGYTTDSRGGFHSADERQAPWLAEFAVEGAEPAPGLSCGALSTTDDKVGITMNSCASAHEALCSAKSFPDNVPAAKK